MIKRMFGLRLSVIGLVPQANRRNRMISDYSYFDVNADILNITPAEAMQFGCTLRRLLHRIHHANFKFGLVYMSKVDLSDGFYQLWLHPEDMHRLAVLFLSRKIEPTLVAIPLTNPMGWVSSPPNFSACTEMVCDMTNKDLKNVAAVNLARLTPRRLDVVSESRPMDESLVSSFVSSSVPLMGNVGSPSPVPSVVPSPGDLPSSVPSTGDLPSAVPSPVPSSVPSPGDLPNTVPSPVSTNGGTPSPVPSSVSSHSDLSTSLPSAAPSAVPSAVPSPGDSPSPVPSSVQSPGDSPSPTPSPIPASSMSAPSNTDSTHLVYTPIKY